MKNSRVQCSKALSLQNERGFLLVYFVLALMVLAVLGAAAVVMFSSSSLSAVTANAPERAWYLSESGQRFVRSEFRVATPALKPVVMSNMNRKTYSLGTGGVDGTFTLTIQPFWFTLTANAGATNITLTIPGDTPDPFQGANGLPAASGVNNDMMLYINDTLYSYSGGSLSGAGPNATFTATLTSGLAANTNGTNPASQVPVYAAGRLTAASLAGATSLTVHGNYFTPNHGQFAYCTSAASCNLNDIYFYDTVTYDTGNNTTTLQTITPFNAAPPLPALTTNAKIILLGTVKLTSMGTFTVGQSVSRTVSNYYRALNLLSAGGGGTPGQGDHIIDLAALPGNVQTGSMAFAIVNPGGEQAIEVTKDQGSGINAEAYVFVPAATPNPFYVNWAATGGYSSYDLQVKIATGTLSGTNLINPPSSYANGLVFRGTQAQGQQQKFLGLSLVRNGQLIPPYFPPAGTSWSTWQNNQHYVINDIVKYSDNNYYQCISAHTSNDNKHTGSTNNPPDTTYWSLLTNNNKAMIVLWIRGSNQGNGDGEWLAYKLLDQTGKDFIVDDSGHTKDWSTLVVRVVEAASVKLTVSNAPLINIGDTITGATGTAKVFRKINDNDGNVVLLMNKITGTFTRPASVSGYTTDGTWGYRSRDNYLWAFYTDTDNHSHNNTPLETSGVNNIRYGQPRGTITWPVPDVQAWTDGANDKFSLVNWATALNTVQDANIHIMGSMKEAGAIIRTAIVDPQMTRPGPYTNATFPGEIGLVSLGGDNDAFFDDLAYFIPGIAGTGFIGDAYLQ